MRRVPVMVMAASLSIIIAGCGLVNGPTAAYPDVKCHAYYRNSTSIPIEESHEMILTPGGKTEQAFEALHLQVTYFADQYEGASLIVDTLQAGEMKPLTRTLYQLPERERLHNQFAGGHGFTGLVYVYDPEGGAELQYYCSFGHPHRS